MAKATGCCKGIGGSMHNTFPSARGAEITAQVVERAFDYLDAPIMRVATPDTPVPFSPPLQEWYIPGQKDIEEAITSLAVSAR